MTPVNPKISVIVPVYNGLDALAACAASVLAQTWTDWELLLVDDGSTDGSGALCDRLAGEDPRIRAIHRPNGGAAAARNAGLDAAAGEYVAFLDADDAYEPEHLETLLTLAESAGADVAAAGARRLSEDTEQEVRPTPGVFAGKAEILDAFLRRSERLYACWNKLFKRSAMGDIRFSPYILAEDALFCVRVLANCSLLAVTEETTYRYTLRAGSATGRDFHIGKLDQLRAWTEIYELLELEAPELCPFAAGKLCHDADLYYPLCRGLGEAERKAAEREIVYVRRRFYLLQFQGPVPPRRRAAAALYRLSPALYYRLAGR